MLEQFTEVKRKIDLGDELLCEIVELVRCSGLETHKKAKTLARAGKIGEMYLGMLGGDDSAELALGSVTQLSPGGIGLGCRLDVLSSR
jgi:hypothetical protein